MTVVENKVQGVESWSAQDVGQTRSQGTEEGAAEPWCRIVEHADGYTMQFGGRDRAALAAMLTSFRGAVPAQRRRWNPATKSWWIDPIVERMFGSLSRWAARSFSPDRVERTSVPAAAAGAWVAFPSGDSVTEGWVMPPEPKPAPRSSPPPGAAGPFGAGWAGQAHGASGGHVAGEAAGRPAHSRESAAPLLPPHDPVDGAFAALWLRPSAPWPVVKAAYRALAGIHHPDKGGTNATMQAINVAYALHRQHAVEEEDAAGVAITTSTLE